MSRIVTGMPFAMLQEWLERHVRQGASYRHYRVEASDRPSRVEVVVSGRSCHVRGVNAQDAYSNAAQLITSDPLLQSLEDKIDEPPQHLQAP